jgi:hypothetical protein
MSQRHRMAAMITIFSVWATVAAFAQEPRTIALVMGYPASVGVLWHVTDGIALRPDVAISRQSTETTATLTGIIGAAQTSTSTTTGWSSSVGLSALFYFGPPGDLRFYLTPRVAYAWSRTETENSPPIAQLSSYRSESDGFLAAGSFGAHYRPHDRFGLFGELGLSYASQEGDTDFSLTRQTIKTTNVGLRSGVGVTIYF